MVKVACILGDPENFWPAKLTFWFTGCRCYHVGWVDEATGLFYDMYWVRRRRVWPRYPVGQYLLFDCPQVTREYLESKLTTDESEYGFVDYIRFSLRWLYHLFGQSTRNANGVICSEMLNNDMRECGVVTPWEIDAEPPSPCDILRWLCNTK